MKRPVKKEFENYAKNYKRRKTWQRVVSMLTCIIVFCTTYALILPAITLSGEAACGMEEHVHADACYEAVETKTLTCSPEHVHTADCYEEGTLICGRADFVLHTHNADCCNESGDRICTLEKLEEHTHTDDCYTAEETVTGHLHADSCYSVELGENVCNLEEQEGHTHEDSCYGEQHLTCEQAEREGHTHTAACYGEATLSCGIEEDGQHTHTDACCTAELRCGETEDPGHTHGGDCYSRDVICCQEESEGHAHSDACREEIRTLTCELEEDGVIAEELVLTCTKPEVTAHTHTDACYEITEDEDGNEIRTLICTELEILEHVHTAECAGVEYKTGSLICTDEEHVHSLICYADPTADLEYAELWERSIDGVVLSGDAAADLVAIAETQIGYAESVKNYIVLEDGATIKGYTRYGQWADDPYGEWNTYFVEFCLHYTGIDAASFPRETAEKTWIEVLTEAGYFTEAEYSPKAGDLIFVEVSGAEYVGVVSGVSSDGYVTAIFGDYHNEVRKDTFSAGDFDIVGYAVMSDEIAALESIIDDPLIPKINADSSETTEPEAEVDMFCLSATITIELDEGEIVDNESSTRTYFSATYAADGDTSAELSGTDMTDLITDIVVYHKTTSWGATWKELTEGEKVQDGDLIRFAIEYEIPGGTLSANNKTIYYQLPVAGITQTKSGVVVNDNGEEVGTYTISESGLITITFHEHYVEENASGVVINGVINFDSTVEELDTDHDGKIDLDFSDSESVEISIEQTIRDDLTVTKTASEANEDGTITYTITVSSENGTAQDVILSDWMSNVTYHGDFRVLKNNVDVTNTFTAPTAGAGSVAMTLPQMAAGDTYTITYTGIISEISGGTATAGNGVTVTSKDSGGNTLTDNADVSVTFQDNALDKEYLLTSDGKVNWTITVGKEGELLDGWTLSDILNGSSLQEPVKITFADGTYAENVVLPYTFGEGVLGPVTVTYTTTLDYNIGASSMINAATLTPPSGKPVYKDTVYAQDPNNTGTNWPLDKNAADITVTEVDGTKYAVVNWTYSINSTLGSVYTSEYSDGSYWYFEDYLQSSQYFTAEQWSALLSSLQTAMLSAFNDSAVYSGANWTVDNVSDLYSVTPSYSGDKIVGFKVKVYQNMLKGTKINFAYQSTAVITDGAAQYHFQNQANINNKTWDSGGIDYYPVVTKMDGSNGRASDTTHAKLDLTNDTLVWKIQMNLPAGSSSVVVTESLPDMVDLVSITMSTTINWQTFTATLQSGEQSIEWKNWSDELLASGKVTLSGPDANNQYTITLDNDLAEDLAGQNVIFTVTTKLNNSFDFTGTDSDGLEIEVLSNSVTVSYKDEEGTDQTDSDTHSQTITNEDTTQQLVKSIGTVADNIIPYTLEVNPNGSNLSENGDILTISDTLSFSNNAGETYFNASLRGVVVYAVDEYGNETALSLADSADAVTTDTYYYTYVQSEEWYAWSSTYYKVNHDLVFTVPDGVHLLITYEYLITGVEGQYNTFSNTATLREVNEYGQSSSNAYYKVESAGATAELSSIYVYKVDKDNYLKHLPGATFELYRWDSDEETWVYDHIVESNGASDLELMNLSKNQAYYLIETKAPDGYVLDQTRHYFMLYDSTKASVVAPSDFPASAYYTSGSSIYITNEKTGTSASAQKKWQDVYGNAMETAPDGASVEVQLMQVWSLYPADFDTSTLGNSATVSLAFGEYSYDTKVFGPISISTQIGDIIDITLKTKDLKTYQYVKVENDDGSYSWAYQYMDYPAGLMEVTSTANNHLDYGITGPDSNGYYTYTFSYLVTSASGTLRGWVYPENNDATVSYSIRSYTTQADSYTTETVYGSAITLSSTNGWTYSWANLPEYVLDDIGRITGYYSYYVTETAINGVSGYTPTYTTAEDGTLIITNRKIETTEVTVNKAWLQSDGTTLEAPGITTIQFKLYQTAGDTTILYGTYELTADSWSRTITDLPKYYTDSNGNQQAYVYTAKEVPVSGYHTSYSSDTLTITNTQIELLDLRVVKQWLDYEGEVVTDTSGYPAVEVNLYCVTSTSSDGTNGTTELLDTYTLDSSNSWAMLVEDLPGTGEDADGNILYYTYYFEETAISGYEITYSTDGVNFVSAAPSMTASGTTTIRNKDNGKISIEVTKQWQDSNGNTLTDPPTDAISFEIFRLTETNLVSLLSEDSYTVTIQQKYVTYSTVSDSAPFKVRIEFIGTEYSSIKVNNSDVLTDYSVVEMGKSQISGWWTAIISRYVYEFDVESDCIISIDYGHDAKGPFTFIDDTDDTSDDVSFSLGIVSVEKVNESDSGGGNTGTDQQPDADGWLSLGTYELTSANDWKILIANLDKGQYKIVENSTEYDVTFTINDGTNSTTNSTGETGSLGANSTVTITNKVHSETTNLPVSKLWFTFDGNQVTGEDVPFDSISFRVVKTWTENGETKTAYYDKDGDGVTNDDADDIYTVSKSDGWTTTVYGLPVEDGVTYSVEEEPIENYDVAYETAEGVLTIKNTSNLTDITVNKLWFASDGVTESIPTDVVSITFDLIQTVGETSGVYNSYTITSDDGWTKTIEDLPVKDSNGNLYTYTVAETAVTKMVDDETVTDTSYKATYSTGEDGSLVITNTKLISITVEKYWKNGDATCSCVEDSIQFNLYQITTNEAGTEIETLVSGSPFTVTKADGWTLTVADLEPGTYRIKELTEEHLLNYVSYDYVTGSGGSIGNTATLTGDGTFHITNSPYMNVTVDKLWPDGTPIDGIQIEIGLYRYKSTVAPGTEGYVSSFDFEDLQGMATVERLRTATIPESGKTSYHKTFKNLPLYGYEDVDGEPTLFYYTYFVLEETNGYVVSYSIVVADGKLTPLTSTGSMKIANQATSIEVTKNWVDKDGNALTDVPGSITFYILQNGAIYDPDPTDDVTQPTFTLSASDGWSKAFYGLPIMDENGNDYTYTVQEIAVDGYVTKVENQTITTVTTEVEGENGETTTQTTTLDYATYASTITNMDVGSTEISVEKVWDTTADTAIQVQLYRIESSTPPSADAVGEVGETTQLTWEPALTFNDGTWDGISTNSDGSLAIQGGWCPSTNDANPNDEGVIYAPITTSALTNSETGLTTYTIKWELNYPTDWEASVNGCIQFQINVPNAYYAIGGRDGVDDLVVKIDGNVVDLTPNYIGPAWDNEAAAFNNDLLIEWYNVWSGTYNNDLKVYDTLEVTFTLPTRAATTDYPEYTTNVTSDYLLANNAEVVTNSGTYIPYTADINAGSNLSTDNYTVLSYSNSWQHTWSDLPLYGLDESGNLVYYTYYVLEISESESWYPSYSVVDPITSGIIGITNNDTPDYEEPGYVLPATGGSGTFPYTLGGIFLLMAGCAVLMYNHKKGRKGVTAP